jgi:magnesium transporter
MMTVVDDKNEILDEITGLLERGDEEEIKGLLASLHPSDIAMNLETLEEPEVVRVFRLLSPETASTVLLELDEHTREAIISAISDIELVKVVDEMDTDDAADVISGLPLEEAKKVLDGISWKESIVVQKLLKYPEDTAGGKMQAELVSVREDATVEETIGEVRKRSEEVENISSVFVVDREGRLTGAVPLEKLILARPGLPIKEIADREPIRVETGVDQEEVGKMFRRYDLLTMPVVDSENRLVGRITIDDVVDVIEEEIFEDFYRMASLKAGERALDPPARSFKMRAPWLLINVVTAFIAAGVVKVFESTIETLVVLAVLMPVVAGLGGNAATQTITVVVRGFALGQLELRNAGKLLIKEVSVGLANGLLVGTLAAAIAYFLGANIMVGLLLMLAMTANLIIAALAGTIIPLILKWYKADPALSASVFVTACTDVGGFFTFLGLAALFMKLGLL